MFSNHVENWLWGAIRISTSLSKNKSDIICLLKKDQHDFKTKMHNISSAVSQGALIRLIKASECITDAGLWSWELEIPGSTWITFKSLNYQAVLELLESWKYQTVLELLLRIWIIRQCLNYLRVGIVSALLGSWHYQALLQVLGTRHYLRVGIAIVTIFTRIQYSVLQPSNCVIIAWFYQN